MLFYSFLFPFLKNNNLEGVTSIVFTIYKCHYGNILTTYASTWPQCIRHSATRRTCYLAIFAEVKWPTKPLLPLYNRMGLGVGLVMGVGGGGVGGWVSVALVLWLGVIPKWLKMQLKLKLLQGRSDCVEKLTRQPHETKPRINKMQP